MRSEAECADDGELGYGIAAFGVGPLLDGGVELPTIYAFSAVIATVMGFVSFAVTRQRRDVY